MPLKRQEGQFGKTLPKKIRERGLNASQNRRDDFLFND